MQNSLSLWFLNKFEMKKLMTALVFFGLMHVASAQQSFYTQDAQVWAGVGIKKSIKKYDFELQQSVRLGQNASELSRMFTSVGVGYNILPQLSVGIGYRLTEISTLSHRLNADIRTKFRIDIGKKKDLYISNRLRGTTSLRPGKTAKNVLRNALEIEYKQKKLPIQPHIGYEWFWGDVASGISADDFGFNRNRARVGFGANITKKITIDIDYIRQTQHNVEAPTRLHIYSVGCAYKL
jgi:hypothetical protein